MVQITLEMILSEITKSRLETNARFDGLDGRIDGLDHRMDKLDGRMDKLDGRMDKLDGRMDKLDGRIDKLDGRMDRMEVDIRVIRLQTASTVEQVADHELRITELSRRSN